MGVAAMLGNMWPDAMFKISSLNDRRPVEADDELIVLATPDPQGLQVGAKPKPQACIHIGTVAKERLLFWVCTSGLLSHRVSAWRGRPWDRDVQPSAGQR
eukprot:scaffold457279_cov52-Prasinocladus_malaysianus.AAC.1